MKITTVAVELKTVIVVLEVEQVHRLLHREDGLKRILCFLGAGGKKLVYETLDGEFPGTCLDMNVKEFAEKHMYLRDGRTA